MKNVIKRNLKRITKLSAVGLVSLSLVGGTSAFAYDDDAEDRYEEQVRANQVQKAQLKTKAEIRSIVAKSLGQNQSALFFEKVELSDDYINKYVYEVKVQVNQTEYHVEVDAKTGKVLSSREDR